jgi:hypothetical protein
MRLPVTQELFVYTPALGSSEKVEMITIIFIEYFFALIQFTNTQLT